MTIRNVSDNALRKVNAIRLTGKLNMMDKPGILGAILDIIETEPEDELDWRQALVELEQSNWMFDVLTNLHRVVDEGDDVD